MGCHLILQSLTVNSGKIFILYPKLRVEMLTVDHLVKVG